MGTTAQLAIGKRSYSLHRLEGRGAERLPYTLRILLENVLRNAGEQEAEAVAGWDPHAEPAREITFMPSRVLLQDFTGVPAVVDLAAMRNAIASLGGDAAQINP